MVASSLSSENRSMTLIRRPRSVLASSRRLLTERSRRSATADSLKRSTSKSGLPRWLPGSEPPASGEPADVGGVERGHVGDEILHPPRAAGNGAGELLLGQ